jgi:hypothetical protein
MDMVNRQQPRVRISLALQVSPCITLGLLLFASFGARAAGVACEPPGAAQRDGQRQLQAVQAAANTPLAAVAALAALGETCPPQLLIYSGSILAPDAVAPVRAASAARMAPAACPGAGAALLSNASPRAP